MKRNLAVFLTVLVASACGGGGGGGGPGNIVVLDLGTLSSTTDSVVQVDLTNPAGAAATLTEDSTSGPFDVNPGALPMNVPAGADFQLPVRFAPSGATGLATGTIVLSFDGTLVTLDLSAVGEPVTIRVLTPAVDFGEVLAGTSREDTIEILNVSTVSPAHVSPVNLPHPAFAVETTLPLTIPPGVLALLRVRYEPTAVGIAAGNAQIVSEDSNGPYPVALQGTTGGRDVTDFGSRPFDTSLAVPQINAQTTDMVFTVPADAISFQIEAFVDASTQIGLSKLTGPNGENFEDDTFSGFYLQYPDVETFVAQVPNTDDAQQQIIPGNWTFRIGRLAGGDTNVDVRVIIQRRPGNNASVAVLDLNVFFAQSIAPTAASAASDQDLQDIFDMVETILSQEGVTLGDIDYYDIADLTATPETYDKVTGGEFAGLLRLSGHASVAEERLNYFLVEEAIGGGVLGVSPKLGGPTKNGTGASGVMGLYIDNPTTGQKDLVARVTAHEVGHYLALRHTAESNGTHDLISDTANCGSGGCSPVSQLYLMHWNAGPGGDVITTAQGTVIRGHGHMDARLLPSGSPLTLKPELQLTTYADIAVSKDWCGTCRDCKTKHELGLGK